MASAQKLPDGLLPSAQASVATGLPAMPPGRSTVMGGQIEKVDLVRDQFALSVPGGHAVKILFDERTQVYQDGQKMSVLNLRASDHASVETSLDGTSIFARRIHILSALPDGQLHGQVISYNATTGELKMHVVNADNSVTVNAPAGTPISRVGQRSFTEKKAGASDLVQGALVDVNFNAGKSGPGTATRVDVLAVPGAEFVFRGNLSFLDLRAGRMSVATTADNLPADIAFDAGHFEASHELHQGSPVTVTTRFDGSRYVATNIVAE